MSLEWKPQYSVGVPEIDAGHREILGRINALLDSARAGAGQPEIAKILDLLGECVSQHFRSEERFMARCGYPGFIGHRAEHAGFVADFSELRAQFERAGGGGGSLLQTQRRVVDWLLRHISQTDKSVGAFLRSGKTMAKAR